MSAPPAAERVRGYTAWTGSRDERAARWWVIAKGNLSLAWANRWVKAVVLLSLIPGIVAGGVVYFFLPLSTRILTGLLETSVYFVFLVGALVGARLISEDRRQGAFIAHFARPVRRLDYLLGKVVALAIPIFVVAVASPILAVAADVSVAGDTLADRLGPAARNVPGAEGYLVHVEPLKAIGAILATGLVASLGTTGLVLGVSAITTRARNAGIIWFAIVALGTAAHNILQEATGDAWPALLSWGDAISDAGNWFAGVRTDDLEFMAWPRLLLLLALSIAGAVFVDWRLRRAEGGDRS